jgi:hypothetical protein
MDTDQPLYLDENVLRMTTNLRLQMANLADALIEEGRKDSALNVLDISIDRMPEHNVPYDQVMIPTIEAYYKAGGMEKGDHLTERLFEVMEKNMEWYLSLDPAFAERVEDEMSIAHAVMERMVSTSSGVYKRPLGDSLRSRFDAIDTAFEEKMQEIQEGSRRRTTKARF